MLNIPITTLADTYTSATTFDLQGDLVRGSVTIANKGAYLTITRGPSFGQVVMPEFFAAPGIYPISTLVGQGGSLVAIAALVLLAIWVTYTVITRNKKRQAWINWITSEPTNNEWKAKLIEQAKESGQTLESVIYSTAQYLFPANPFKAAK